MADAPTGRVLDRGVMAVTGPGQSRTETFQRIARPDGGFSFLSTIAAADGSYVAEGRWDYDANAHALGAMGTSKRGDASKTAGVTRSGSDIELISVLGGQTRRERVPYAGQLIDMEPSVLPMTVMIQRYDRTAGGAQPFTWVGVSLLRDLILTGGTATLSFLGALPLTKDDGTPAPVEVWAFDEALPGSPPFRFHLWTGPGNALFKFTVSVGGRPASTTGVREGLGGLADKLTTP